MENNLNNPIKIEAEIPLPVEKVWQLWTEPEHIKNWNNASEDWHSPHAVNDLRNGGDFSFRMEAKDGSFGFDFGGTYTSVIPNKKIEYTIGDGRKVAIDFEEKNNTTFITEYFEAEGQNPRELQQQGWQSILNNFKKYAESR